MQFQEILIQNTSFLRNGKDITSDTSMVKVSGSSVTLKNSVVNRTLGTAIEVKNVKDFTADGVLFLFNNGSAGSCLVVKNHSNVSLVDTIFKQNTNPVIDVKNNDGINISLEVWFISSLPFYSLSLFFFDTYFILFFLLFPFSFIFTAITSSKLTKHLQD